VTDRREPHRQKFDPCRAVSGWGRPLTLAHGGRVGCRSQPGAGSLFWFELPRAEAVAVFRSSLSA
jgi:hypothetical protein